MYPTAMAACAPGTRTRSPSGQYDSTVAVLAVSENLRRDGGVTCLTELLDRPHDDLALRSFNFDQASCSEYVGTRLAPVAQTDWVAASMP